MRNHRTLVLLAGIAATLMSCKSDTTGPREVVVATVVVSLPRTAFRAGESIQAAALPLDSSGGVVTGRTVSWSSSNPDVATVSASGLVKGISAGAAVISASADGKDGTAIVNVSLVPVTSVTVVPGTESVSAGASVALSVILKDSADRILTGRHIDWTSSAPSIASVTAAGVVNGILVGAAEIVATVEGKTGKATINVNTLTTPVATITLNPTETEMSGGATKQITATLRDANGNVVGNRTINWSSSNPARATVSSDGTVTANPVDGSVTITASVEGKSATASVGIHTFTRMSTGTGFSCALTGDGTAYCWGTNTQAQLGDGSLTSRLLPVKVATDAKFVAITSGVAHSCALIASGEAYCWGDNSIGQVGTSTATQISSPVAVNGGRRFVSIAAGDRSTCATTAEREVYCWGSIRHYYQDFYGGRVAPEPTSTPRLSGSGMVAVVAGTDGRFCSVDAAGLGYCWTVEFLSPINGNGASLPDEPPVRGPPVSTELHFTTLRVGHGHTCGVIASGQAYCWGNNLSGQLGDGTTVNRSTPTLVSGGLIFESIAAGGDWDFDSDVGQAGFTCGLTVGGKTYCWGSNRVGALGTGAPGGKALTQQPVLGGILFTGIRASFGSVCGLAVGGAAYCWGSNGTGQIGNGTTGISDRPALVFGN